MRNSLGWVSAACFALVFAGCSASEEPVIAQAPPATVGHEGRLEFASTRCDGCTIVPFMANGSRRINVTVVNPARDGDVLASSSKPRFESSAPAVFDVKVTTWLIGSHEGGKDGDHGATISVDTKDVGRAELRVFDGNGALVDRIDFDVKAPTRIAIAETYNRSLKAVGDLAIDPGKSRGVLGAAYDGDTLLDADGGFLFTSADPAIVAVNSVCGPLICFGSNMSAVLLAHKAAGTTTITMKTASGLTASIPVTAR